MSSSTSIIYGIGSKICQSESIGKFLKDHEKSLRNASINKLDDILKDASYLKAEELYNKYEFYENNLTSTEGLNGIITEVIFQETGIRLDYQKEQDTDQEYILFSESLPWYMNEEERNLTENKLNQIMIKYFSELQIDYLFEDIKLEYFG